MPLTTEMCPYCGEELKRMQLPGSTHFIRIQCECEGAVAARRAEMIERRSDVLRMAWEHTGVPKRYLNVKPDFASLDKLTDGHGLYIFGVRGVGKTHHACEILKAYVAKNTSSAGWCSSRFISASKWLDGISECYGKWNASAEDAFQTAANTGLLVFDDFGKVSRVSEWSLSKLFRLVDERYCEMKPTVFTSKYSLSQLAERFDAIDPESSGDMISRIRETCERIEMSGSDLRLGKSA